MDIQFIRGKREQYSSSTYPDAIYFATDDRVIIVNDIVYGFNESLNKLVKDVTYNAGILTVTYTNNTEESVNDLNALKKYESAMPNDLTVPTAVGGIAKGTTAESLKAKTISQVLDDLLFPEVQPTVQNPSASIALKSGFSNGGIYEVGAAAPENPDNFTVGFNRGTVTCPGKPNQYRAGAQNMEGSFIYYNNSASNTSLPTTVTLGSISYKYRAAYGEGDTLVTSKGNKASLSPNPLTAGSVDSGAVTIYGTYPYFCNGKPASNSSGVDTSSLPTAVTPDTKLPLQKWTDTLIGAMFASEASTGTRLTFDFPAAKNVTKVEFYNTVSGKWEAFSGFTTSATDQKDIQGNMVSYNRLTTNGSLSGALQLRFTVANA